MPWRRPAARRRPCREALRAAAPPPARSGASRGRWWWAAALAAFAALLLYLARPVLAPFVYAAALAYLIDPLVERLHRRGLARSWAVLTAYALSGLLIGALLAFVVPALIGELGRLAAVVPNLARRGMALVAEVQGRYRRLPLPTVIRTLSDGAIRRAESSLTASLRGAAGGLTGLLGGVFNLALAPVLAYYVLVDLPRFRERLVRTLPPGARQPGLALLADLDAVLSGFVRGQLVLAACVGTLVGLTMWALRVRFALLLGAVGGLGEMVPYFGPILGALPALGLAATQSFRLMVEVGVALLVIQQVEGAVLGPKIVGRSTGLHPLTVVFALLAGGHWFGVAGLVLAVPLTCVLTVCARHLVRAVVAARAPRRL